MSAVSRRQQKWAYAVKGPAWARKHHFNKIKRKRVKTKAKRRRTRRRKRR